MQNSISINIVIGDRNYRIRIDEQDEESVRKISKQINDKIIEFKTNFAGKDMQDYISMVLLWFVTEQQQGGLALAGISEELDNLEAILDKA
ncbi:MAG TPA: cell division protein ZapA [Chitinophagaceae bacterium]|nr:cell division protein ZapA [Chitinophagaceae bacterium]